MASLYTYSDIHVSYMTAYSLLQETHQHGSAGAVQGVTLALGITQACMSAFSCRQGDITAFLQMLSRHQQRQEYSALTWPACPVIPSLLGNLRHTLIWFLNCHNAGAKRLAD